jgi:stress-induced morphogen
MSKPVETRLNDLLNEQFAPAYLATVNESHMHSVPSGSETHFKVVLVSAGFENLRQVQRHQRVYKAIAELMSAPIHALSLHTFTPAEWQANQTVPASPDCKGGSKKAGVA